MSSAQHDFSKLETRLLKIVFSYMRYGDIYFCSLVCKSWQAAVREYFLTLPRIHALKMTHDPWPSERMASYMMCPSCLHIGLSMAVNARELNLCVAPYKSLATDDDRLKTLFNIFREAGLLNKVRLIWLDESTKPLGPALTRYFPSAELKAVSTKS